MLTQESGGSNPGRGSHISIKPGVPSFRCTLKNLKWVKFSETCYGVLHDRIVVSECETPTIFISKNPCKNFMRNQLFTVLKWAIVLLKHPADISSGGMESS